MYILVDCVIFDMHNQPVAAEQKYDWGGWRESLWSSRISVRSVRVQRSKNCFGCLSLWVTLSEWYITSNLLPGMSFILQCDSDYVRTCRLCKIWLIDLDTHSPAQQCNRSWLWYCIHIFINSFQNCLSSVQSLCREDLECYQQFFEVSHITLRNYMWVVQVKFKLYVIWTQVQLKLRFTAMERLSGYENFFFFSSTNVQVYN